MISYLTIAIATVPLSTFHEQILKVQALSTIILKPNFHF